MGQKSFLCAPCSVSLQQACEMVMDILRERDQGGFGDRNEYGSRIGGGIDVSAGLPEKVESCSWGGLFISSRLQKLTLPSSLRCQCLGILLAWSLAGVER